MQNKLTSVTKLLLVFVILIFIIYPVGKLNAQEITSQKVNFYDGFMGLYPYYPEEKVKLDKMIPGTQKGLYMAGCSMGELKKRNEIYKLIQDSELNCIVFNAKDDAGYIDYDSNSP